MPNWAVRLWLRRHTTRGESRSADQLLAWITDLGLQFPCRLRKLSPQRLAGAGMKNFCVLTYVDGRPVSAERLAASSAAEAVRQVLLDGRLASCEVFEGKRKVAVIDDGFITIAGQPGAPSSALAASDLSTTAS